MKSNQFKHAITAALLSSLLGLTACGGESSSSDPAENNASPTDNDGNSSDNNSGNNTDGDGTSGDGTSTDGNQTPIVLSDPTWAPASENLLALTYSLTGGSSANVVAAKHMAKTTGSNQYKIMEASLTDGDLNGHIEGTFSDTTDEEVDVAAFKNADDPNDSVIVSCVSGKLDAGSINSVGYAFMTGATFNISLASDANNIGSMTPLTYTDNNVGGARTWTVTECRGLSEASINGSTQEYTFLAAVQLARTFQDAGQTGTFAEKKDAIISVSIKPVGTIGDPGVSITNPDVTVDVLVSEASTNVQFTNVAAISDDSFYYTSDYTLSLLGRSAAKSRASIGTFYYSRLHKFDGTNGNQTMIEDLKNPFTGLENVLWSVSDMQLVGDKLYLVSDTNAGLVEVDTTATTPVFTLMDGGDYQYCKDALAFNGYATDSLAKMWCHDSTDNGTLLEFAPKDITVTNAVDNTPTPAPAPEL